MSVSFDNNGLFASGSSDYTIKLWNVTTGDCLKTLTGHKDSVNSVSFNHQGLLASGSLDKDIKVWNISTGKCLKTLTGHKGSVLSVSFDNGELLASGSSDKNAKVWDVSTGKCLMTLEDQRPKTSVNSVSFGINGLLACGYDNKVLTWKNNIPSIISLGNG